MISDASRSRTSGLTPMRQSAAATTTANGQNPLAQFFEMVHQRHLDLIGQVDLRDHVRSEWVAVAEELDRHDCRTRALKENRPFRPGASG